MSYLVDANVLCEATRPEAEPHVLAWLGKHSSPVKAEADRAETERRWRLREEPSLTTHLLPKTASDTACETSLYR